MGNADDSVLDDWFKANRIDLSDVPSFLPNPEMGKLDRVEVFVDETGDRNFKKNRQSDWFAMTAVMVPAEHMNHVKTIIRGLRDYLGNGGKPVGHIHWVQHCKRKKYDRRVVVRDLATGFRRVRVIHVIIHKPSIAASAHMRNDTRGVYYTATKYLLERIGRAALHWDGGARSARVTFATIKGVDPEETKAYLNHCANESRLLASDDIQHDRNAQYFDHLKWPAAWRPMGTYEGLELADIYSGFLSAALRDGDSTFMCRYSDRVACDEKGRRSGFGVKVFPEQGWQAVHHTDWWHEFSSMR
ncbi:DUF3800 domain-containing protein [Zhihengliuella flava]|uniref:DUF3800 domain-containing protein n=1 Tax=Zhihengliuella flava TaxID=1285193 RepID=A0A931GGJ9_9MICC|nr:DUF3800 domain-containing protein [Zhihengliuella flava]MBG6085799.1 hypothetical protein [Zhihengliuella flava]MBG6085877.1 hypothetical protein [Zhihengliuella flava]